MVGLNENESMMTNMINYSYTVSSKNNRSYFHAIIDSGKNPSFEPFHFIWKFCVLIELKFLLGWSYLGSWILSDALQRKNPFWLISPSWCIMCRKEGEVLHHLFLHCEFAWSLWIRLLKDVEISLGVSWILGWRTIGSKNKFEDKGNVEVQHLINDVGNLDWKE